MPRSNKGSPSVRDLQEELKLQYSPTAEIRVPEHTQDLQFRVSTGGQTTKGQRGKQLASKLEKFADTILSVDTNNNNQSLSPIRLEQQSPRKRHKYKNEWTILQNRLLSRIEQIEAKLNAFDHSRITESILSLTQASDPQALLNSSS